MAAPLVVATFIEGTVGFATFNYTVTIFFPGRNRVDPSTWVRRVFYMDSRHGLHTQAMNMHRFS